ncbi:MAG: LutB/LldF family L-lactate oxidation iron-sulfur protein [Desulfobacterium sp.]|jgi:L-lactate dehydrogenase complex protein LldF|nr:LutB/LldF family L-lactate oxidation iron-sulfur protein [Desulfobacterium sp.]
MDNNGAAAHFDFKANVRKALKNSQLRSNLKFAMGSMTAKRRVIFSDSEAFEALRVQGSAIRRRALLKLPELLERLEKKCTENGISVHWAETTDEANRIALRIVKDHNAVRVVKGKSMVSEEMHLNHFLAEHGIESLETDLGEFIIQLDGETPSHIIVPAIHKNRQEIARTFQEKIPGTPYTEVVEELNAIARKTLRRKFYEGEVGLSGVNMAVAETGTLCLVENEGNGRMCTTVPPVHIAVMGIEKVVEKLADVPPLVRLLTGSATGQLITTYVNMITSPRRPGEKDGPTEVHLILLDNGRSSILSDPELRQTLQCIRCGTCLNHCPVYTRIGGHAYGFIYPGPIGKILTPQMEGLEKAGAISTASTLCNACEEVCPVKIPIPNLIRRIRDESYDPEGSIPGHGFKRTFAESAVWKGWELVNRHRMLNAVSTRLAGIFGPILPRIGPLNAWTRMRTRPVFAKKSLHDMAREEGIKND